MTDFLAACACGQARRGATLGAVTRWAEWHQRVGCEGTDHVVWVGYDPPTRVQVRNLTRREGRV